MYALTRNSTVSLTDYGDYHKKAKRNIMMAMLGFSAQKQFRDARERMINNVLSTLHRLVTGDPHSPLNFREVYTTELFGLSLIESLGEDVSSVYVEELGREVSKEEMFEVLVHDMMMCGIEADWRDYFPYLSWVPNKSFETKVFTAIAKRNAVMRTLIKRQKERIARGEQRLYQEIREVCGDEAVTEDDLPRLPYLNAVFHETLRRHSAVPVLAPRFVHEDTKLGGYDIPAGTQMMVNVYGCHMDDKVWDSPEDWLPERFLGESFDAADRYKTLGFGAGRRICAGSLQAVSITSVAIARFVQELAWRLGEADEGKEDTMQFTALKLHPLHVHLTPRSARRRVNSN
ncbi:hypothetical protein E2562_006442 [Oryza meyeriana var. granulata]|uniref:Ent-kaurene oxidase n=1 Tax=Oryza meyeriana var. granulata TaxID=110450 RepID=A0A6G1CMW6_9ORYZ|nr:hypothetical protein E2562_006442 [Oryza meyeriana var. granulata]